ncbi:MAG: glutamate--tRNA ligase family protein [Candidatus Zambryskibacteria bacterium]
MENKKVIVRFPPSPTGPFHIGNARTFLFNYLFAKQNSGQIVFRLEDTDKERSKKEYADDIIENLKWLGIEPDFSTTVKQSERSEIYKKYIEKLIAEGKAYLSKEEVAEEGQRAEVIRFKNPNKKVTFNDLIRGNIEFDTTELKDFVIAKSLDEPVYHLAVVIDDFEMRVTHVIRGDDGISNTPRQILIQEAIGAERPIYAHLPMMLAPDGTKLSKRKHGEQVSVSFYKNAGYMPEAVINFLAMVGWNPGTDQEIWSMNELVKTFDIKKVQKRGAIFNIEKLDWLNREYILKTPLEEQISNLKTQVADTKFKDNPKLNEQEFLNKFLKIILDRIHRWGEVREVIEAGELVYFFEKPVLEQQKILWKNQNKEDAKKHLGKTLEILDSKEKIMQYAEKEGKGEVLWPLRYALSGREKSPDPFTLIDILGITESKERIQNAIQLL